MLAVKLYNTTIPSDIRRIGSTVCEIIELLNKALTGIDENIAFDIRVILNELLINAIKHGNKGDICKVVHITAGMLGSSYVFIMVRDEGDGYDYRCILDKCRDIFDETGYCGLKETGRGIMIVASLCERVKFSRSGSRITVLKKVRSEI